MKTPVVILPQCVDSLLKQNIPTGKFEHETMLSLFGVPVEDGELDIWCITHAFRIPGQHQSYVHVDTLGVRYRLQIMINGLTVAANGLGLEHAQPVGVWHTHPDGIGPSPSWDDRDTYQRSARLADLGYWLAPIATRGTGTVWMLWDSVSQQTEVIPGDHIYRVDDTELERILPGLGQLARLEPGHLLMHLEDLPDGRLGGGLLGRMARMVRAGRYIVARIVSPLRNRRRIPLLVVLGLSLGLGLVFISLYR